MTSATETLTVRFSGALSGTTTGIVLVQLKPTVLISENATVAAAGTSTRYKAIATGSAIYLSERALTGQLGKPWVKIDPSALTRTVTVSLGQLFYSIANNNFANQTELLTVAKNSRVVGTQTIDGTSTTEYAGSFPAAQALKALPAAFRKMLAPALHALGDSTVVFRVWIDGQHYTRKITEVATVNGISVKTTLTISAINQPVHIAIPPVSQIVVAPGK